MDQGYRVPGLRPAWTTFVGGELSCSNVLRPNLPHLIFWATVIPLKCYVSNDAPENGGGGGGFFLKNDQMPRIRYKQDMAPALK